MATPNETNSGPSGESATLLHTALFKQVSSEEAEELLPHLQHAEYSKGDYISAKATPITACICWNAGASN